MKNNLLKFAVVFLTLRSHQVISSTSQIKVDDDVETCSEYKVITVHESVNYDVIWTGREPSEYCKYGFVGAGEDDSDKYKICVEILSYLIQDCNIALRFNTRIDGTFVETEHTCGISPQKICGDESQKFDIELTSANDYGTLNSHPSSFTLRVTSHKTFDNSVFAATVSGIVLGCIVFIAIIIIVVVVVYKFYYRRKNPEVHKSNSIKVDKLHHLPYTVPVDNQKSSIKRKPSFSSLSSEQFNNNHLNYLPYSADNLNKTAHIY